MVSMKRYENFLIQLHSLAVFRSLLKNGDFQKLYNLLNTPDGNLPLAVFTYSEFAAVLMEYDMDISGFVHKLILNDINPYSSAVLHGKTPSAALSECLKNELNILQAVCNLKSAEIKACIGYEGTLPDWQNSASDLAAIYDEEMRTVQTKGFGIFKAYHMFTCHRGELVPVKTPDEIRLGDLCGYMHERTLVLENTRALLDGKPAANILLYGDSGTGKSSTIKAVANELYPEGLRLVEIAKSNLSQIPELIRTLSENPLKFILYIDDLSFAKEDDNFTALKAMLEGSILSRSKNLAIYATSNRRRLIKESFSDRQGDDVHISETIQQTVSLSERFSLAIPFSVPSKEEYLGIVAHIADIYHITEPRETLFQKSEIFALEKGGRSGRVARQFIEQFISLN
jgi:predicted AAA+ superfamily ATPase